MFNPFSIFDGEGLSIHSPINDLPFSISNGEGLANQIVGKE